VRGEVGLVAGSTSAGLAAGLEPLHVDLAVAGHADGEQLGPAVRVREP
jgi:hypothetical protein